MSEIPSPQPPPKPAPSGAWRGVAGCFATAVMSLIGGALGVMIGINCMPPKWDRMQGGSEFHGLSADFERLCWLVGGLLVGLLVGAIAGAVLSVICLRRR